MLLWPLLIAAGIFLILLAVNPSQKWREGAAQAANPIEVLKRRYARGEIDRVEFETTKQAIK